MRLSPLSRAEDSRVQIVRTSWPSSEGDFDGTLLECHMPVLTEALFARVDTQRRTFKERQGWSRETDFRSRLMASGN